MLTDITLKKSYSSSEDNVLNEFYIPCLSESVVYRRTTAFFNSTSLIQAAKGMAYFYTNDGRCQLISGLQLSEEDYSALVAGTKTVESFIDEDFLNDVENAFDKINLNHLRFLSWLVQTDRLEIKIAVVADKTHGIYHEKFGIFQDINGNEVSFIGSINETSSGWISNIEQFLVFRGWMPEEKEYVRINNQRFDDYWNNNNSKVLVFSLPDAIRRKILEIVPRQFEIKEIVNQIKESDQCLSNTAHDGRKLRPYQQDAIDCWKSNDYCGVMAMATGSGKTFTALRAIKSLDQDNFLLTIAVPQGHLVTQWIDDIRMVLPDYKLIRVDSKNKSWRKEIRDVLFHFEEGYVKKIILVGTYASICSSSFLEIIKQYNLGSNFGIIADEVHNFGATSFKKGMVDQYKYRIGLSATPLRYFDEEGTNDILNYFGKIVFEYNIEDAIRDKNLTPYEYIVDVAFLSDDEMDNYYSITDKMKKVRNISNTEQNDIYMRLANKRARILKQAESKIEKVELILDKLVKSGKIKHLLIYCDNLKQLSLVQNLINSKYHLMTHKFTGKEPLVDRKLILEKFDDGTYQAVLAIKCLDEGVDVPSTDKAIIIASSGNSREYIQRRGRVLRLFDGKEKATIYDLIVLPPDRSIESAKIVQKEFKRVQDFCKTAINSTEVSRKLYDVMNEYGVYF